MKRGRHKNASYRHLRRGARGVTMIELMVGFALGAATSVLIAQVVVSTEQQRRATASGSDAQLNGALVLNDMSRSIKAAGYGMTTRMDAFGCAMRARFQNTTNYPTGGSLFPARFEPMLIQDGGGNNPDTLTLYSSDKSSFSSPVRTLDNFSGVADSFRVNTLLGSTQGDLFIAVPPTPSASQWCTLIQMSNVPTPTGEYVEIQTGAGIQWNQPLGSYIFPTAGYEGGGDSVKTTLVNMGTMDVRRLSVGANESLIEDRFTSSTATNAPTEVLYPNVVNFQAWYGKDAAGGDDRVDVYNTVQPTNGAEWSQVRTVRVAVVTRDPKWERDIVTTTAPVLRMPAFPPVQGAASCGTEQCITFDVSANAEWQHHRYQVHDMVIPLRNLLWNTTP